MSKTISINLNNCLKSNDTYKLDTPIALDNNKNYQAGLVYFSGWNNIHNITTNNNIFIYSADKGEHFKRIELIPGAYEISDIDKEIKRDLLKNNDFNANTKTYPINLEVFKMGSKAVLNITNENYIIDFTKNKSLNELLGFEKQIYQNGYNIAEQSANISTIQTIHIDCDLIDSNHIIDTKLYSKRPVIYSFPAYKVPIGARIIEEPARPRMYNLGKKYIDSVNINIYDNNLKPINFNGEMFSLEIIINEM